MSVLDLASAKRHLNIDVDTYDTELTAFIASAEAVIAQRVGPLSTSSVTKRVPGYGWNLHLPIYPAVSLTSVTPVGGSALTLSDLYLEQNTGTVSYNGSSFFSSSAYDVVYVAGRSPIPDDLLMAVKKQLRDMWADQRGSARPGVSPDTFVPAVLFSREVEQLLQPYETQTLGA